MKNFQPELFLETLNKKLNNFTLSDNKPVDPQFNKFMTILTDTVNEHAPLKKASRREKRLQQKPWLTQGLLKSEVTNMRPAKEFPAAREHFGETSTFKHFFPV